MNIIDDTNTMFAAGIPLATRLLNELNAFAVPANVPGGALLGPLLANPAVTVTIKNTGATATAGQRVTVNTTKTNGIGNEFVESVIFELTNASNHAGFTTLETNLKAGAVSLLAYGQAKADLEAEASWNVAQILNARGGYVPSAFGTGTINACNPYPNLAAFQVFFRAQPHDAQAAANNVMSLPSWEMYAYNGAVTLAGGNNYLNAALGPVPDTRFGQKRISPAKLKGALGANVVATVSTQQPLRAARFYWTLVEVLRAAPANVAPPWRHGGIANWEFTPAMRAVTPDTPDPWQPKIAAWIATRKADMYL